MIYFDATFLVRLYVKEPGFADIRALVRGAEGIASSVVGKMEMEAAFHRKLREGSMNETELIQVNAQASQDTADGLFKWIPLTAKITATVHQTFLNLPASIFLRTGDAIHLATASEAGLKEIYSNDRHLLTAAPRFKLKGINPLAN